MNKKNQKEIVELRLDYWQGPIWISDVQTGEPFTCIDVIDNDEEIRKLNYEIYDLYDSFIVWDEDSIPRKFDHDKARANKDKMLELLKKLNDRLNEINDGTYVVDDRLTEYYKKL